MTDIITQPIKFLGATVLSFNTSLGLGSAEESTLNVELIEDCQATPPDDFWPTSSNLELRNSAQVGAPVYFSTALDNSGFSFGGVLSTWTESQGGSGKTYNVKVVDPRQLLENTTVVLDSYVGPPSRAINYFNVFAAMEGAVLNGDCSVFGSSWSNERGMPYLNILSTLKGMNRTICSPTGYNYTINFDSFPMTGVPEYYRVTGPSITLLQLLQDVCEVLGYEFYARLLSGNIIEIGTIDLRSPPSDFRVISSPEGIFNGIATELSFGEELRNEKTKALIFGEQVHYLSPVYKFNYYFGEEWDPGTNDFIPIVPLAWTECYGFWIKLNTKIRDLNLTLNRPLIIEPPLTLPLTLSEYDIKAAMASYQAWYTRVCSCAEGSFNDAVRRTYNLDNNMIRRVFDSVNGDANVDAVNKFKALVDQFMGPVKGKNLPDFLQEDLNTIHAFVQNLGTTYYGKQWFTRLNDDICYYRGEKFQEKVFTSTPTNAGGWVDYGTPVLGLSDPDLGTFRETDDRIGCFVRFSVSDDENTIPSGILTTSPGGNPSASTESGNGVISSSDYDYDIHGPIEFYQGNK